jgi:hypothetical protein
MLRIVSVIGTLLVGIGSAQAVDLCARQRADGTFNTTVKIREVCKSSEVPIDLGALGVEGPPGPQGPAGPPLDNAAIYSRETVIVLPADASCPATSGATIGTVTCDSPADVLLSCGATVPPGGGAVQAVVREDASFSPESGSATQGQCVARGCSAAGGPARVAATCVSASATTTTTTTLATTTTTTTSATTTSDTTTTEPPTTTTTSSSTTTTT